MGKLQQVLRPGESVRFALRGMGMSHFQGGNFAGNFRSPSRGGESSQVGHP